MTQIVSSVVTYLAYTTQFDTMQRKSAERCTCCFSVAFMKGAIRTHIIMGYLPEYVAICFVYYGLTFFRLTFILYSCILSSQVNIPFKCLWMW